MKAKAVALNLSIVLILALVMIVVPVAGQADEPPQISTSIGLTSQVTGPITESLSVDNILPPPPIRTPVPGNPTRAQPPNPFGAKPSTLGPAGGAPLTRNNSTDLPRTLVQPLTPAASTAITTSFSENFDDVTTLAGKGWAMRNNSAPPGSLPDWYQGVSSVFPAHSGVITSYVAINYNSAAMSGTISNWLFTPVIQIKNGDRLTFYTRTAPDSGYPDRLEVRMSRAGVITDVGTSATSVGVFTTTLLSINPTLALHGYPERWIMYSVVVTCLPEPVNGRFAFRYFVTNGGPSGSNSNYIGVDTFNYDSEATVLYDNGPLVTQPGAGFGGADASAVQSSLGMGSLGFGNQILSGYRVADDFTVTSPCGWDVESITFFGYQTNSTLTSTFNTVNYRIWNGVPGAVGSSVLFGNTTTNRLVSSTFSNIYRVTEANLSNTTRPVMANTARAGFHLDPGTYWLDWQAGGTLSSGPWVPPISVSGTITTGNALQFTTAWNVVQDTSSNTQQGLPFIINRVVKWKIYLPVLLR